MNFDVYMVFRSVRTPFPIPVIDVLGSLYVTPKVMCVSDDSDRTIFLHDWVEIYQYK